MELISLQQCNRGMHQQVNDGLYFNKRQKNYDVCEKLGFCIFGLNLRLLIGKVKLLRPPVVKVVARKILAVEKIREEDVVRRLREELGRCVPLDRDKFLSVEEVWIRFTNEVGACDRNVFGSQEGWLTWRRGGRQHGGPTKLDN